MLLDFAFSKSDFILAACSKNFTILLWDFNEDFKYQSTIKTFTSLKAYQSRIWYINYIQKFVTTDELRNLNIWNMKEGKVIKTIKVPNKRKSDDPFKKDVITDIEEIEYL